MKASFNFKLVISVIMISGIIALASCGGKDSGKETSNTTTNPKEEVESPVKPDPNDPMQNKGIGPITSVTIGALDNSLAEEGKTVFEVKCIACHKFGEKFVGPDLSKVTERRTPEWIMNMILNPTEMIANDPIAKKLLGEMNGAQMANQNLTEDEARAVLEYFRSNDSGSPVTNGSE